MRFRKTSLLLTLLLVPMFASISAERAARATFVHLPPALYQPAQDASVAYQINAQHSGSVQGSTLKPPLKQLWSQQMGGTISYPLVVGEAVYVAVSAGRTQQLHALRLRTGGKMWGPVAIGSTWSALAYENGRVFSLDHTGLLQAFDAQAGTLLWKVQLSSPPGSVVAPPTAYNGIVYVGGFAHLHAVRATDGAVLWRTRVSSTYPSAPAVDASGAFVFHSCGHVDAIEPLTGAQLWRHDTGCHGGAPAPVPVLHKGNLYVRLSPASGSVFGATSGKSTGAFASVTAPVFHANLGFYLSNSTLGSDLLALTASDLQTGKVAWSFTGDGKLAMPPIAVNGILYLATGGAKLYALDGVTGKVLFETALPAAVSKPDERNQRQLAGLGAGSGVLVVPMLTTLAAYSNDGSSGAGKPLYFPETKHNLGSPFREFWERNGGLALFGYPLTEAYRERSKADGKEYLVQYFERNRLEYHPEATGTSSEIQLGLLGVELTVSRRAAGEEPFKPVAGGGTGKANYFPQTGHVVSPLMYKYWEAHGGLAIFGYPISEQFHETSPEDSKQYLVQYFERNRFEYHPENAAPYDVLLGRLGLIALQKAGKQP